MLNFIDLWLKTPKIPPMLRSNWFYVALVTFAFGCGDNVGTGGGTGGGTGTGGGVPVADCPDQSGIAAPAAGRPGAPCAADADCDITEAGGDGFCLNNLYPVNFPDAGYCLAKFLSEPCNIDTDCGDGAVCGNIGGSSTCLLACNEDGLCAEGYQCTRRGLGNQDLGTDACLPATCETIDGERCESVADCSANSLCLEDPIWNIPDGACATTGCNNDSLIARRVATRNVFPYRIRRGQLDITAQRALIHAKPIQTVEWPKDINARTLTAI